jgi:nitrite reductase/ring-hydroxylating ferredoxin subunit
LKIIFCQVEDVENNLIVTKWVDEWKDEISALTYEGDIYVLSTICPHLGGEFRYSSNNGILRCKWHAWEFSVKTGKLLTYPIATCLKHYQFEITNKNEIEVVYHGSA